ncbi:MAG: nicotinate-nucleotide adenylyltransferase [Planctomycetales bacterium]|nr:nicotinate-nucleotide adenylyltransferase [Planctomycetales bacterium]
MANSDHRQRIGVIGGTFDPIHIGHLLVAERVRETLALNQVRFIPAATSPLKIAGEAADGKHRLEMVKLAIGGNSYFIADDRELRRGGKSYTVDTLAELHADFPEADLVFLMGADSLMTLDRWHQPEKICQLAFVAVVARGGEDTPDMSKLERYLPAGKREKLDDHLIRMPQIEISSSEIRSQLQQRRSVRYQLHPATAAYIEAHQLYAVPTQEPPSNSRNQ